MFFKTKQNDFFKGKVTKEKYSNFFEGLIDNIDEFSKNIGQFFTDEEIMKNILTLVIPIARNGFLNENRKLKLFYECQKMGVHIQPTHFYSAVPQTDELSDSLWSNGPMSERPLNFDNEKCFKLLKEFEQYKNELKCIENNKKDSELAFYWNNPAIGVIDACLYYYMIRHFKPRRCVEVGSGYSTLLATKAATLNKNTEFEAIEPYPLDFLKSGINGLQLIESKIQDVPLEYFDKLEEGDILFIDNSHVSKVGSDVNHIMLRILPRLKQGVIIHFHDIFLPYEFPQEWVKDKAIFWNEQYILQALLEGGNIYETLIPVYYLGNNNSDKLESLSNIKVPQYSGGSYWIKKVNNTSNAIKE